MSLDVPTLSTERLVLRPFTATDADDLSLLHSNAFVLRYWDAPPWTEPARAQKFLAGCLRMAEEGSGARLAVEHAGTFLGWCSLTRWNPTYRSAALGLCFGEASWGQGFGTEAAGALLTWAFESFDLHRVQAELDTRNVACARVLEKLGFAHEGTLREDCVVDGVVSDSWVYGLLSSDRAGRVRGGPQHS